MPRVFSHVYNECRIITHKKCETKPKMVQADNKKNYKKNHGGCLY